MKTNIVTVGLAVTVVFAASFAQAFAAFAGTTTLSQNAQYSGSLPYYPSTGTGNSSIFESGAGNGFGYVQQNSNNSQSLLQVLLARVAELQRQLDDLLDDRDYNDSEVDVETDSATNIDDDRATVRGEVDLNDSDYAYVWFEYGESRNDLDDETSKLKLRRSDDFSATLRNLDDDQDYYYRAMAEDEDGEEARGDIGRFETDRNGSGNNNDDEPEVSVDAADDVDENSAEISGDVDMNDFRNGIVFFVYGEDEDQVEDVADDFDSYTDVDEDGDDLQKVRVDSDLDDDDDYTRTISGLDNDTEIFFALCVEYEDDDDDTLECSSVRDFETDRN